MIPWLRSWLEAEDAGRRCFILWAPAYEHLWHTATLFISRLHLAERWCRVVASAASGSRKSSSSLFKRELHANKLLLLMKDSRSDCLAVRQIKLQRSSAEWAVRCETRLCLHEERSERSLKLRKLDQRNKWRSISPEELLQAYRDVQKV